VENSSPVRLCASDLAAGDADPSQLGFLEGLQHLEAYSYSVLACDRSRRMMTVGPLPGAILKFTEGENHVE